MNKRIKAIASLIDSEDKVADIGCDQALLAEILAKKSIYSIASDIKENIISNAKIRIKKLKLDKYIEFIVSDGLENIPEDVDTLVLSGMGTHTILSILEASKKTYKKIITISNNNHDILRINLLDLGYKVSLEEIILDKNKFYNLIVFTPGKAEYNKEDLLIGINHINENMLNKKLKNDLKKYKKIYNTTKNNLIQNKINIIEKMLVCHY